MTRFLMPIVFIGIAVTTFFVFAKPTYDEINSLREQMASYSQALDNSKALEVERDALTQKLNNIDPANLEKLRKLLPANVDNIRLILEIGEVAAPYGMVLKNVKYNSTVSEAQNNTVSTVGNPAPISGAGGVTQSSRKDYSEWDLEFSITGSYQNFVNFTKDLEKNLRIVDISTVKFSSDVDAKSDPTSEGFYDYNFKIKTYWLNN